MSGKMRLLASLKTVTVQPAQNESLWDRAWLKYASEYHTCICMMCRYNRMDDTAVTSTDSTFLAVNTTFLLLHKTFSTCFDLTLQVIVRSTYSVFMSHFWVTDKVRMRFEELKNANGI
jgi:hypothetical protein